MATGKLGTDEVDDLVVDSVELSETIDQTQYSSIDSIKEDEEEFVIPSVSYYFS